MSLLFYANILELVDLFEDEEYTEVVTLCVECITWKEFPESPHERTVGNFSLATMYSNV